MRVIHLIGGGDTGGAKTHVLHLLKELNRSIDAQLVCFRRAGFSEEAEKMGIPIHVIDTGDPIRGLRELKKLSNETGLFSCVTDEEIAANAGKTYQDLTALRDPMIGLGFEDVVDRSFGRDTGDALALDYNPYHDPSNGRFTSGGGSGKIGKTKYAPSPQRSFAGIQLKPKTYSRLCGTLGTQYPGLPKGAIRQIMDSRKVYTVEADGYGGMRVLKIKKI